MLLGDSSKAEVDAAHTRVKTEDLARAIASLEARKQEEARRLEGTLVIGDAIRELQIEATPEEVLAEVEAQRATRRGQYLEPQIGPAFNWRRLAWIAGSCGAAIWVVWATLPHGRSSPPSIPHPALSPQQPATYPYDVNSIADIPEGTEFYCLPSEVQEIINEPATFSKIAVVSVSGLMQFAPWTLVKHGGTAYIHGWILKPSNTSEMARENVLIYNADPEVASRLGMTPVTVRIGNFRYLGFYKQTVLPDQPGATPVQLLSVANLHLDRYAWEKW